MLSPVSPHHLGGAPPYHWHMHTFCTFFLSTPEVCKPQSLVSSDMSHLDSCGLSLLRPPLRAAWLANSTPTLHQTKGRGFSYLSQLLEKISMQPTVIKRGEKNQLQDSSTSVLRYLEVWSNAFCSSTIITACLVWKRWWETAANSSSLVI